MERENWEQISSDDYSCIIGTIDSEIYRIRFIIAAEWVIRYFLNLQHTRFSRIFDIKRTILIVKHIHSFDWNSFDHVWIKKSWCYERRDAKD